MHFVMHKGAFVKNMKIKQKKIKFKLYSSIEFNIYNYPIIKSFIKSQLGKIIPQFSKDFFW